MTTKKQDIAIIVSGISGVSIGNMLNHIANVTIFEKSRGVGGRIATRYIGNFEFDHGTQFFTIKTDGFQKFIQPLIDQGIDGSCYITNITSKIILIIIFYLKLIDNCNYV